MTFRAPLAEPESSGLQMTNDRTDVTHKIMPGLVPGLCPSPVLDLDLDLVLDSVLVSARANFFAPSDVQRLHTCVLLRDFMELIS